MWRDILLSCFIHLGILEGKDEGSYLVRVRNLKDSIYALAVVYKSKVTHHQISREDGPGGSGDFIVGKKNFGDAKSVMQVTETSNYFDIMAGRDISEGLLTNAFWIRLLWFSIHRESGYEMILLSASLAVFSTSLYVFATIATGYLI